VPGHSGHVALSKTALAPDENQVNPHVLKARNTIPRQQGPNFEKVFNPKTFNLFFLQAMVSINFPKA
jgi:hypothetical protein